MTDHEASNLVVGRQGQVVAVVDNNAWYQKYGIKVSDVQGHVLDPSTVSKMDMVCLNIHKTCVPSVPLVGHDVAFTKNYGMVVLEINLSCNFFASIKTLDKRS